MTFDSKNRYRNIKDAHADELENIEKIVNSDHWRQKFHIMPKTGLLNDPNGLSYFLSVVPLWTCSWFEALGSLCFRGYGQLV